MPDLAASLLPYGPAVLFGVLGSFAALLGRAKRKMPTFYEVGRGGVLGLACGGLAAALALYYSLGVHAVIGGALCFGIASEPLFAAIEERVARFVKGWKPDA